MNEIEGNLFCASALTISCSNNSRICCGLGRYINDNARVQTVELVATLSIQVLVFLVVHCILTQDASGPERKTARGVWSLERRE